MTTQRQLVLLAILVLAPFAFARAQSSGKGLVINEIYIGSMAASGKTATDQFIEIYNPQSTTQYLDGCMIVRFGAPGGKLAGSVLQGVAEAWKFPGQPGAKTLAVQPGQFFVIAASAKKHTGGLDLSNANAEAPGNFDGTNPNATQLQPLGAFRLTYPSIHFSETFDAVVLTNGLDATINDGINLSTVIDGVQYNTAWTAGNLPASIDGGFTGGPNLKYGVSMERKAQGVTTLNSSRDFLLYDPSPGSEHGKVPPPPPPVVVKVTDLMPLDKGRYVDYHEYTTDSLGAIQPATVAHSSYTVFLTGLNFGGSSGVALVRDTANGGAIAGGSTADFHYLPTAAGDMQVYADTTFFQQNLPPGFGTGLTAPNKFVDYLKMSAGENTSYPVTTLTANVTYSGYPITITVVATGKYVGIGSVTVPQGRFDSAYRFALTYNINASYSGILPVGSSTAMQQIWLVKGIGIVKTNVPTVNFNITNPLTQAKSAFPIPGTERDMTAHGVRSLSSVSSMALPSSAIRFYPDPAPEAIKVELPEAARQILLYAPTGQMVRSYDIAGNASETVLWVGDIPNGAYLARIRFVGGTMRTEHIVVQH
jgi:hypothetical protein